MELAFEKFLQIAESSSSQGQPTERIQEAKNAINEFHAKNPTKFMIYSTELVLLKNATIIQITNGLNYINSILIPKRYHGIDFINFLYNSISEEQKVRLKQALLIGIKSTNSELRTSTSSSLSIIAQFEFPREWPNFFTDLEEIYQDKSNGTSQCLGVLQSLNNAFQSTTFIRPRFTNERKAALTFVTNLVFHILSEEAEIPLKTEAVYLLSNSFKYVLFRNFLQNIELIENSVQLLQDNFEINDNELHSSIYYFFATLFVKAYEKAQKPIQKIESLMKIDLECGKVDRQIQVLKLLMQIASHEKLILRKKGPLSFANARYSSDLSYLFSKIIINLTQFVDESFNYYEDDKSLSFYAYQALKSLNEFDQFNIIELVKNYFESNYQNEDWKVRCSTVIAVRAILDKDEQVKLYVRSIFNEIMALAQNPQNLIVKLHAQSLIASFIKYHTLMDNKEEETQFIIDLFTELIQQDDQQTISGLKIIKNFIKRYNEDDFNSPISTVETFHSILNSLWLLFERPEITNEKFSQKVTRVICLLCHHSSFHTIEVRKDFCIEVLKKFKENANFLYSSELPISSEMTKLQSNYLLIIGKYVFSIRSLFITKNDQNGQFINEMIDYFIQLLPNMDKIPGLLCTIGNIMLSITNSAQYEDKIFGYLAEALSSKNPDLIAEGSILLGDFFRKDTESLIDHTGQITSQLIDIIENDDLPENAVCQSLMALADIVRYNRPENILPVRDRILKIIQYFTHFRFNPNDQKEIEIVSKILEGIIYLSGSVIKTFSTDAAFIGDKKNAEILFDFRFVIDPDLFTWPGLDYSMILFCDCALSDKKAARSLNIYLNHHCLKEYLDKIVDTNKNPEIVHRAKIIKDRLINA